MFPVYGGKCSSHKGVHNWIEKHDEGFAFYEEVVMEVAETTVKDFCAAGFTALVMRWNKCINVGGE
jgi:hypothetical protein